MVRSRAFAAVFSVGLLAPTAYAESTGALEEIVVTAQKREESLQTVPVAVTAFTAEALNTIGLQSAESLEGFAPNLFLMPTAAGSSDAFISIRGAFQLDQFPPADAAVGVYLDGVYIPRQTGNIFNLVDVERIEVLNGPQGTLYGRNTTGGLINVISTKPNPEAFEAHFRSKLGTYTEGPQNGELIQEYAGILNVPLSDRAALRGSVQWLDDPGYAEVRLFDATTSPFAPQDTGRTAARNDADNLTWHVAGSVQATDSLDFLLNVDGFDNDNRGSIGVPTHAYPFAVDLSPFVTGENFVGVENTPLTAFGASSAYQHTEGEGAGLTIGYQMTEAVRLKNIVGYRQVEQSVEWDCDHTSYVVCETGQRHDMDNWSEEFQFSFDPDGAPYDLLGGLYYFEEKAEVDSITSVFFAFSRTFTDTTAETKSAAAYLRGNYHFTNDVTAFAGFRYNHEKKTIDNIPLVLEPGSASQTPIACQFTSGGSPVAVQDCVLSGDETWDVPTWEVGLNWQAAPSLFLYGKFARGYRSGGHQRLLIDPSGSLIPFKEETVDSYELGFKSDFWDGRGRLNLTTFFADYQDFQRTNFTIAPATGGPVQSIVNIDEQQVYGVEVEFTVQPVDDLLIRLSLGIQENDSKGLLGQLPPAPPLDVSDLDAPLTPKENASWLVSYTLGGDAGTSGEWSVSTRGTWRSEQFFESNNSQYAVADGYEVTDLRLDVKGVFYEGLDVGLFVNNVFDTRYSNVGQDISALGYAYKYYGAPRSVGLQLDLHF